MLPILFQSPDFILYSYPLFMGLGWGLAYQIFFELSSPNLPRVKAQVLFWGIFLFSWLGAKLFFYLTLPEELSQRLLNEFSFWTGGGFVFYGGLLGGACFLLLLKIARQNITLNHLWPMLPALTLGHAVGRVGCLLAGCCYGEVTDGWWGIYLHGSDRHPTQLLEATGLLMLGIFLWKSQRSRFDLLIIYLSSYGLMRFSLEFLRGDSIRGQWGSLSPSQWVSISLIFLALFLLIRRRSQPFEPHI
jgi:phosphatidylglycerol---prolipoprotein diacylglyceryl transferase